MTPIDEVFDFDQTRDRSALNAGDAASPSSGLEALIGSPRRAARPSGVGTDAVRLVALVDSAAVNSSVTVVPGSGAGPAKKTRGHRRVDWLNTTAAVTAAIVVAATATFAGVQAASASPAAGALQVLTTDEASLASAEGALAASRARLTEGVGGELADIALLRSGLDALKATDAQPATADERALTVVIQANDAYGAQLEGVVAPEIPAAYERGPMDEESLTSVAKAINEVQTSVTEVDDAAAELQTARAAVDAMSDTYTAALIAFAGTFAAHAAAEVEANPSAEQSFRDAVGAAAASVKATPLSGTTGAAALATYRDAVLALRADDFRARVAEETERGRQMNNNSDDDTPPEPPEPSDPARPTDPSVMDPTDPGGSSETPEG